ncbi:uncharacterized protein [Cherax quadricarinatus]|uniref:uncharacterized protein n=1 Tax=Cherax quadricarinatus TaxID=27406 RepID=UPI00387EC2F8
MIGDVVLVMLVNMNSDVVLVMLVNMNSDAVLVMLVNMNSDVVLVMFVNMNSDVVLVMLVNMNSDVVLVMFVNMNSDAVLVMLVNMNSDVVLVMLVNMNSDVVLVMFVNMNSDAVLVMLVNMNSDVVLVMLVNMNSDVVLVMFVNMNSDAVLVMLVNMNSDVVLVMLVNMNSDAVLVMLVNMNSDAVLVMLVNMNSDAVLVMLVNMNSDAVLVMLVNMNSDAVLVMFVNMNSDAVLVMFVNMNSDAVLVMLVNMNSDAVLVLLVNMNSDVVLVTLVNMNINVVLVMLVNMNSDIVLVMLVNMNSDVVLVTLVNMKSDVVLVMLVNMNSDVVLVMVVNMNGDVVLIMIVNINSDVVVVMLVNMNSDVVLVMLVNTNSDLVLVMVVNMNGVVLVMLVNINSDVVVVMLVNMNSDLVLVMIVNMNSDVVLVMVMNMNGVVLIIVDYLSDNYQSDDHLSDNYLSDDYLSVDYLSNDYLIVGYLSDNYQSDDHLSVYYLSDNYLSVGYLSDNYLSDGYLSIDYLIVDNLSVDVSVVDLIAVNLSAGDLNVDEINGPLREVWAVKGGRVLLPCDMEPPLGNDSTHLVLFYHGDVGTPIYSLDSRNVSLERARHWAEKKLGGRAYLRLGREQRGLVLQEVQLEDAGDYRCRVDFVESPTRNLRIRLDVVVPPNSITITSSYAPETMIEGRAGPFPEGSQVTLSCQVIGGHPRPEVTWWHEESLLDDMSEVMTGQVIRNDLSLALLTRSDLNKTLTCQAMNSNLSIPLSKAVTIDMMYPPTWVQLVPGSGGNVALREGVERLLTCESKGSRPPASFQWFKNGVALTHYNQVELEGEVSRSTLSLTPDSSDNGAMLTCRGFNPGLPDTLLENSMKLSVFYKPQLELQLGPSLELGNVEEDDDIVLKCVVKANPAVTGVQWAHNGVPLQSNVTQQVRVSRDTLLLKAVTRASSGSYTCAAANSEGATTSNILTLAVRFPPMCREGQQTVYGAARHETLNVPCHVQAYPEPFTFRWAVNTSTGVVDVALNLTRSSGSTSIVSYTPQTHHDFGHLLCWAVNDLGVQHQPCIYQVIPAAKPEAVLGCRAERNTTMPLTYVALSCQPGWDGGLNQTFTLEVRQVARKEVLEAFHHSNNPHFIITGLKVGVEYLITVTAANSRGSSLPLTITYTATAASADKVVSPHAHTALLTITPFLVFLLGVIAAVSACAGVAVMLARRKRRRKTEGKIVYAGPLNGVHENHDVHTFLGVDRECENEDMVRHVCGGSVITSYDHTSTMFINVSPINRTYVTH